MEQVRGRRCEPRTCLFISHAQGLLVRPKLDPPRKHTFDTTGVRQLNDNAQWRVHYIGYGGAMPNSSSDEILTKPSTLAGELPGLSGAVWARAIRQGGR